MVTRRELLFGLARDRSDSTGAKPVSGIGENIMAADAAYIAKDYAQAKALYKDVLKEDRNHKEARVQLGLCYYQLGEYLQCKDTLLLVLKKHPDESLAALYLGLAYARRDQIEKCMIAWDKFLQAEQVDLMREINVQRAFFESGESLDGVSVADAVEQAMRTEV